MSATTFPQQSYHCDQPIFGQTPTLLRTIDTLLRVEQLNSLLPGVTKSYRQIVLANIQKIWVSALQHLETTKDPQGAKEIINQGVTNLGAEWGKLIGGFAGGRVGKGLAAKTYELYTSELKEAQTAESLQTCVLKFLKDSTSAQVPAVQGSHRGINGPTLLVSFARSNGALTQSYEFTGSYLNTFILKWTTCNEFFTTRIYSYFSQYCSFHVPQACCIDLKKKIHIMSNGSITELSSEVTQCLEKKLLAIAQASNPSIEPKQEQILILDRIPGENLFDFGRRKYLNLSYSQRIKFFNQLAQLAILDLVLGNQDRLIQTAYNEQTNKYQILDGASNLGNAMVTWAGNDHLIEETAPKLYAIDNGIGIGLNQEPLIHNSNEKTEYLAFLCDLLTNPHKEELLTSVLANALTASFKSTADDECGKEPEERVDVILKQLTPLLDDLGSNDCHLAFQQGIKEMLEILQSTLIPGWNSQESGGLKCQLLASYPELIGSIAERFEAFRLSVK